MPDYHRYDEPLLVEVEQDGTWWPGYLFARMTIDGQWWGAVDRHVGGVHHQSPVPYSRIRLLPEPTDTDDAGTPAS